MPLNILYLLLFIIFLKQKKRIVEHIKQDPVLLDHFYESLGLVEGSTNFVTENIDIDQIINSFESGFSDNDNLTFTNFCSKDILKGLVYKLYNLVN